MKVLFFGAGPLGLVYAHFLHEAGGDVTVLARGEISELALKFRELANITSVDTLNLDTLLNYIVKE